MKKIIILLLVITLVGCNGQNIQTEISNDNQVGLANPIKTYDSLDKINEVVGCHLALPSSLDISNILYTTINDEIAQVSFDYLDHSWTLRGSKDINNDISGVYDDNNVFESKQDSTVYLNDYYIERLFIENQQYTIVLDKPNNFDEESFGNTTWEIMKSIKINSDPNHISGNYIDAVSKKATMTIDKFENNYEIYVNMQSEGEDYTEWYMVGNYDNNKITYSGESFVTHSFDNSHQEMIGDGASNNIGYFEIKNNKLYWSGAVQDQCKKCIFEKID